MKQQIKLMSNETLEMLYFDLDKQATLHKAAWDKSNGFNSVAQRQYYETINFMRLVAGERNNRPDSPLPIIPESV